VRATECESTSEFACVGESYRRRSISRQEMPNLVSSDLLLRISTLQSFLQPNGVRWRWSARGSFAENSR
jgi:hypothetical protein